MYYYLDGGLKSGQKVSTFWNTLEGVMDVVGTIWLMTSSNTAQLNCGRVCLLRCTFVQRFIGSWYRPVCVLMCPNKCSSLTHVIFSLQQHTTIFLLLISISEKQKSIPWLLEKGVMKFDIFKTTNSFSNKENLNQKLKTKNIVIKW